MKRVNKRFSGHLYVHGMRLSATISAASDRTALF